MTEPLSYLSGTRKQFAYYKMLGERTMAQLSDEQLVLCPAEGSNSIAVIVKHLGGNMLSRWTDFLTTDGEKSWRKRETEFDPDLTTRAAIMTHWDAGWAVLLDTLNHLTDEQLGDIVYIRNMGHTVLEAINRQLAHYAYHVGQMVYLGKMLNGSAWESLSIPRGASDTYNKKQFGRGKRRAHFTDED